MLLVWSWPPPFFAPKGVDRPWTLAFTASALRGRLAVGTYSNLSAPPPGALGVGWSVPMHGEIGVECQLMLQEVIVV